jgi:hypothetical protein
VKDVRLRLDRIVDAEGEDQPAVHVVGQAGRGLGAPPAGDVGAGVAADAEIIGGQVGKRGARADASHPALEQRVAGAVGEAVADETDAHGVMLRQGRGKGNKFPFPRTCERPLQLLWLGPSGGTAMTSLKDILTHRFGYRRGDFGATGLVRVDCEEGTISPVPLQDIFTPRTVDPAKVVRLADLFRPGQVVGLNAVGREPARRFTVLTVTPDGLMVEGEEREFLPWNAMRHGLIRPEMIVFGTVTPAHSVRAEKSAGNRITGA